LLGVSEGGGGNCHPFLTSEAERGKRRKNSPAWVYVGATDNGTRTVVIITSQKRE